MLVIVVPSSGEPGRNTPTVIPNHLACEALTKTAVTVSHMIGASGKVYEFLSALSKPVSPENPGHLAEFCSEQTGPLTVD
ncbi:hypothetical protein K0M31_001151 [Melipona bicolor]|uniref:Uncharacterized protein n=1 Tax=Melipona bicolor TaxID=60889 RepID=A0AA40GF43_9HYME|nr:hypothetical protein K0M31_001151 [Melipona bicolor]